MADKTPIILDESNRRKIFGTYDGEGEEIERLKQYYFKNDIYQEIISEHPLKILVGNKGVGKSALFKVALAEAKEFGKVPIMIKPDDVAEIAEKKESLLLTIRTWKFGLTKIIAERVLSELGLNDPAIVGQIIPSGGKIIQLLLKSINRLRETTELLADEKILIDKFVTSKQIIVFLDDIDRGWQDRKEGVQLITALIAAIRDLSNENPGLTFKLALRLDVYNAVRTFDESGDKYEGSVVNLSYKIHEIFVFLIKRILTFQGEEINDKIISKSPQSLLAKHLSPVFEERFRGSGKWENVEMKTVLTSLIRNRPRDLVKLCATAAKEAHRNNSTIIKTEHIKAILPNYSESIIEDTVGEYISELPSIEKLIYGMRPTKKEKTAEDNYRFTTHQLHEKLRQIMLNNTFNFASKKNADPATLKSFLYKINFITARKTLEDGTIIRSSYEENPRLSLLYMNETYDWEVHLAYRWALQPDSLEDIFSKINIT